MAATGTIIGLVIIGYLVGGIPIGVLVGQARGVDIRRHGSGNIGASNVFRTLGAKAGLAVWLADVGKGFAPVMAAGLVLTRCLAVSQPELWLLLSLVAVAAFTGHCFSPYLKLRGGRGVSTSLGILLAIDWRIGLCVFAVWLIVVVSTRYISLASILAAASAPAFLAYYTGSPYYLALGVVTALLLIGRHQPNIGRLLAGTESKIGQKVK